MNKKYTEKIIKHFSDGCKKLGYGVNKQITLAGLLINVWRDGNEDIEFGNLFDIHTYDNKSKRFIDDECGVYIDDLEKELRKIVFREKEFSTL